MPGHTEGWLRMLCLNTDRNPNAKAITDGL
jgi:hypothetical protein